MHVHHHLHKLPKKFCVALYSDKEPYFQLLVDTIHFFLKYKEEEVICLTLEHSAREIKEEVGKLIHTDRLAFVDGRKVFRAAELEYNHPLHQESLDEIWMKVNLEIKHKMMKNKEVIVIIYYVSSLLEYLDIDNLVTFLSPFVKEVERMGASIVMINGIREGHSFKDTFHGLVNEVIEV